MIKTIIIKIHISFTKLKEKIGVLKHRPNMLKYIFTTRCPHCKKLLKFPKIHAQNTAYEDKFDNFTLCCKRCQIEESSYWDAMWNEYNQSRR